MEDVYDILAKYFLGEASTEECKIAEKFRLENELEFSMLERIWKQGNIEVVDFDAQRALQKVKQKAAKGKKVSLFRRFSRYAAVLIFIVSVSLYVIQSKTDLWQPQLLTQTNSGPGNLLLALPDGSEVWLNKYASISYPEKFKRKNRKVRINGEVFFEVERKEKKPFVIETSNAIVEVLGTSFNINNEHGITEVDVTTGKVSVKNQEQNKEVILTRGMSAIVNGLDVSALTTSDSNYLSWKTGNFSFTNATLQKVVNDINSYVKKPLVIDEDLKEEYRITLNIENANMQNISELLELVCNVEIKEQESHFLIQGKED